MQATPDRNQWWEEAACLGDDINQWVYVSAPADGSKKVDKALSTCAGCPVLAECLGETVATLGVAPHTFQVRAGLRLWIEEDKALLSGLRPDPLHRCETCRRSSTPARYCHHGVRGVGNPHTHAIPETKGQGGNFNPHTRGDWNS